MITPMIAAYFLKAHGQAKHGEGWLMDRYMSLLRWTLRNRWKSVGVGFLCFVAQIFVFAQLPQTFQPDTDEDTVQVSVEMPPGVTLEQTRVIADRAAAVVRGQSDVASVFESVRAGNATIFVSLKEQGNGRARTSTDFQRQVGPQLQNIADARVFFRSQNQVGGRPVSVLLTSSDPAKLQRAALQIVEEMRQQPELRAPRVAGDLRRPEITITPRLALMADMGVTTSAMSQAIRVATQGEIDQGSARFSLSDRQVPIRVMLTESSRRNLSTIENMPVPTTTGGSVPLRVIADIRFGAGPSIIQRINQERRILIGADLAPGVVDKDSILARLPTLRNLPEGVERARSGQQREEAQLASEFLGALVSGVFLVFAVLVLLYKRLMAPFVNMGSLLLAPLGGLIALWISGHAVSMPVYIGILMLFGIVAKNSILLLDFTIEEMAKGVPKNEAILDAGHKRAQPIVMTTMAMIAGMVPTALSLEGDSSWRAPMAVVVIGGLLLSTILTLVLVPATFSLADGFERWLGPKFGRILTYKGKKDHGPSPSPQAAE
jgi:multidrug efflux pump subunit AcrB